MSTLFLSKPNENLTGGGRERGLTMHDDVVAEQIKDTWYRANNIDKIKAREKIVKLKDERGSGPFTAISDWLMVTGETVRDKASWRKAVVVKIDDDNNKRTIRYADNGSELKLEVYQLEIFAHNNDVALIFRDWFQTRTPRLVELPPIRQHGEETLCSVLNGVWDEECETSPPREMSPIEIAFISHRLTLGTVDSVLKEAGIDIDSPDSVTHKQFAFEIAGHSELTQKLSKLAPLPKGGESKSKLPPNKPKDEVTPWGVENLTCVPLWWDANSSTLRCIQSLLRHRYYHQYAHWTEAELLGSGNGIKEGDNAAVLVLITMDRLGPPLIRDSGDRTQGLRFDVPCDQMTTLLQAQDLVQLPMSEPMHLHSPGFSWPCPNNGNGGKSGEEVEEDVGYYRQAPRRSTVKASQDMDKRGQLLAQCCMEQPIVVWKRELNRIKQSNHNSSNMKGDGDLHYSVVEEMAPLKNKQERLQQQMIQDSSVFLNNNHDDAISIGTSFNQGSLKAPSFAMEPYQSVRDSLIDSRRMESEFSTRSGMSEGDNLLLTQGSKYSSMNESNNIWGSEGGGGSVSGNKAALERKEADKYSVVLNNTTNSYANASLWSEEFKEKSARPLNHHVLAEPPTVYHPSQSLSDFEDSIQDFGSSCSQQVNGSASAGAKSVRPRAMTPRSRGKERPSMSTLDTPGQQARFAASKFKTTTFDVKGSQKESFKSKDGLNSSPHEAKKNSQAQLKSKIMSPQEAEDSGHRLTYRSTAAKWAGPIAGKERGYGNYPIRSTTRRVVSGPPPTEQHGKWERPSKHDEDYEFHAQPPARSRWETKALRLANAYDVPEKPNPYPLFRVGEKVRAQSFDQPHAWFDAKIVTVLPDVTGDPAATKYNVRYEGYKQQPSGTSLGKDLPVEMIKGASSLLAVDR